MMGLSQIDMVTLVADGKLQVCGPLKQETGDSPDDKAFFAVVRQDDLVAVGRGGIVDSTEFRWRIEVDEPTGQAFQTGPAVASVTITLRKEDPPGLETLSWVQPVTIKPPRLTPPEDQLPAFAGLEVVKTHEDQLTGQSVASSLAIRQPTAEAGLAHSWEHRLELLPIPPDPTDGSR
jgi:hypothetical protein